MSDLISRQAAIDEIDEWINAFRENVHKESAADARLIQDGIIRLPSAEHKKGKWTDLGGVIRWGCPHCHYAQEVRYNFCPNCGADMREEHSDQGSYTITCRGGSRE